MKKELKNGLILFLIVIFILLTVYLVTAFQTGEVGNKKTTNSNTTESKSDSSSMFSNSIILADVFNRSEDCYKVLFYSNKKIKDNLKTMIDLYDSKEDNIKLYKVNYDDPMNKKVLGEENINDVSNSSDLKVRDITMITIKNKKVESYLNKEEDILKSLE